MDFEELGNEFWSLVETAKASKAGVGFGYMGEDACLDPTKPAELYVTCRMTHVFALAAMLGLPEARFYLNHGVQSLLNDFHDAEHGGWYSSVQAERSSDGEIIRIDESKAAYSHAFVVLAGASAYAAGHPDGPRLLEEALRIQKEHFIEEDNGRVLEAWDRAFEQAEDYRGINANMHTVESWLAASDVLDDPELLERATSILKFVYDSAATRGWRIPEHYSAQWEVLEDYNAEEPAHPFRPFGVTPGHAFEWARLLLHARGSRLRAGLPTEDWMLQGALSLVETAVQDGWAADGGEGFVYTTDFAGSPVVHERMHWVLCEALGAASVLTRELRAADRDVEAANLEAKMDEWWNYALRDVRTAPGHWTHELNRVNERSTVTWDGMPDVYHAAQMALIPRLPSSPTFAAAVRDDLLHPPLFFESSERFANGGSHALPAN